MFVVYTTKDNLIRLCSENESSWYKIIMRVKKVVLSEEEDWRDNPLLLKMHQSGVDFLTVEQSVINDIITNHPEYVLDDPCSAYLLDIDAEKAKTIQSKYGVICQSQVDCSNVLVKKGWRLDTSDENKEQTWLSFFSGHECPLNTIIIVDRYFFSSEENESIEDSFHNLRQIMDALLPIKSPSEVLQVCIVFDFSKLKKKDKRENGDEYTFKSLAEKVNKIKRNLRDYSFIIEMISVDSNCKDYSETHDRRILTNFSVTSATHKLKAFSQNQESLCSQEITFRRLFEEGIEIGDKSTMPSFTQKKTVEQIKKIIENKNNRTLIDYACNGQVAKRGEFEIKNRMLTFS